MKLSNREKKTGDEKRNDVIDMNIFTKAENRSKNLTNGVMVIQFV